MVFQMPSEKIGAPQANKVPIKNNSIKRYIPKSIKKIYWRVMGITEDKTEMHCFDKNDILDYLAVSEVDVLDIRKDNRAGPSFLSYLYIIRVSK